MQNLSLKDFLTETDIQRCIELTSAQDICAHVIAPNIDRINATLGQKNDPMFLAYAVLYAKTQSKIGEVPIWYALTQARNHR